MNGVHSSLIEFRRNDRDRMPGKPVPASFYGDPPLHRSALANINGGIELALREACVTAGITYHDAIQINRKAGHARPRYHVMSILDERGFTRGQIAAAMNRDCDTVLEGIKTWRLTYADEGRVA